MHNQKVLSDAGCTVALLLAIVSPAFATSPTDDNQVDQTVLDMARAHYLSDVIKPHLYTPGKNSFLYQTLHKGQRKTLLDLTGSGSVRHLWSTWSIPGSDEVPPGRVLLHVFVDGQTNPSIVGTIDELCLAAQRTGTAFVPFPAFIYKDAYNLYLPIYFSNGIRIEAEALDEINEFYTQIDYRLDGEERSSARLVSESTAAGLALKYTGAASLSEARNQKNLPEQGCGPCSPLPHGPARCRNPLKLTPMRAFEAPARDNGIVLGDTGPIWNIPLRECFV